MNKLPLPLDLTIIIPCFNESTNLENTVKTNIDDAKKHLRKFEVIIVDDGSTDESLRIAEQLVRKHAHVRIVKHQKNLGLGAAILSGAKAAIYDFITYLPGDGQAYVQDIISGLRKIENADLVLTYRTRRTDYTLYRKFLSRCLTILLRLLFGLGFRDYNWVHIYRKNIFSKIDTKSTGVFFLAEIVIKAHRLGLKIVEVESVYRPRLSGTSKTVKFKSICKASLDMLRIWLETFA